MPNYVIRKKSFEQERDTCMKEIGGYFQLEQLSGNEYYQDLLPLNLGRTALLYALEQLHAKSCIYRTSSVIPYQML